MSDESSEDAVEQEQPDALAPEDFYREGACLVFTSTYHLKRGFCCNSGCRHCPYKST